MAIILAVGSVAATFYLNRGVPERSTISGPAQDAKFGTITAQEIDIVDQNGKTAETINPFGTDFLDNYDAKNLNKTLMSLSGSGITIYPSQQRPRSTGYWDPNDLFNTKTNIQSGGLEIESTDPVDPSQPDTDSQLLQIDANQIYLRERNDYSITLGLDALSYSLRKPIYGLDISSLHYDKAHSPNGIPDYTEAEFTPQNISMTAPSGNVDLSIGRMEYLNEGKGQFSIQSNNYSAISLFGNDGTQVWRAPSGTENSNGSAFDACVLSHSGGSMSDFAARSVKESCIRSSEQPLTNSALQNLNMRAAFSNSLDIQNDSGLIVQFNNNVGYTITSLTIRVFNNSLKTSNKYTIRSFYPPTSYSMTISNSDPTTFMMLPPGLNTFVVPITEQPSPDNKNADGHDLFFKQFSWSLVSAEGWPN
jgi:hypothetical protein